MRKTLLAAALAAAAVVAGPILARSAEDADTQQAQAAPAAAPTGGQEAGGGGAGQAMPGRGDGGMQRWPMMHRMMMGRTMMRQDPQERCVDRLAWRAARRAYVETKLDLTPAQRPLWDKVQSAAQTEAQKERQLCASLKAGTAATLLDRMDRMQQFLSARLDGLQAARPALQALYQALTPQQQTILDHPFRHG